MKSIDESISHFMGLLLGRAPGFDAFMLTLSGSNLLKGAVLIAAASCFWIAPTGGSTPGNRIGLAADRAILVSAMLASCVGEVIALAIAKLAPFRLRPFLQEDLAMHVPQGLQTLAPKMMQQSSFPSDHAVLFFAMATGLWLVNRRAGWLAFGYVSTVIALPRLYLGLHFASDLIVGAMIGVVVVLAGVRIMADSTPMRWLSAQTFERPVLINPILMLITFQIATMLSDLRDFADLAGQLTELDDDTPQLTPSTSISIGPEPRSERDPDQRSVHPAQGARQDG